jgi:hypothetical protein
MPESGRSPFPQELQFQRAEPIASESAPFSGKSCVACRRPISSTYFHAQGQVVCPSCAERIQSGQQAAPPLSLARAALYGAGAGLAGAFLYATVAIVTGLEVGLIAIVVGYMVGKAIRHASNGLGGRPQQILAVTLTYFAITTSYIPVFIYHTVKHPRQVAQTGQSGVQNEVQSGEGTGAGPNRAPAVRPRVSLVRALLFLLLLAAVAPFLSLGSGISGLISLFIIFIGLQRAWRLTGRSEILVMGPYESPAPAVP